MTDELIYEAFLTSPQNKKARCETVNALRHRIMDQISFNVKDDDEYMLVYGIVMEQIASKYPSLSWEVKRQMAKKSRRYTRRIPDDSAAVSVYIRA
jgi:hypothetical protein